MEALIARAIQILIALGGAYILTLWFAIVVWTFQDIQARSRSVVAQIFSTLVVLIFSIPGLLIYLILRPRYTLDDAFQRSLEEEYLMQDLEELPLCPECQQFVEDDWVFCPNCRTELRDNCIACDRLIDLRWEICPFCGTEQYVDEDTLPEPIMQPVMAPSPQFLGRPQMNQAEAFRLTESQEQTRQVIPATVRVDLRSGDVLTEPVPELPISSPIRSVAEENDSRRVLLDGNGLRESAAGPFQPADITHEVEGAGSLDADSVQEPLEDGRAPDHFDQRQETGDSGLTHQQDEAEINHRDADRTDLSEAEPGKRPPKKRRSRRKKSSSNKDSDE